MLRLLLDEGVSPSISPRLWAESIDNYPLRDRGLLGLSDHAVWELAKEQGRAVVTINGADFRRLARRDGLHAGLVVIPSGGSRDDHFHLVVRGVSTAGTVPVDLSNRILDVSANGDIQIEMTHPGNDVS